MIGKVKKFFGIESVKLRLDVPEEILSTEGILKGKIILNSMSEQTIKSIEIKLVEKYERGRRADKLINDYIVGRVDFSKQFKIQAGKEMAFEFNMPYVIVQSEMDKIGQSNFVIRACVRAAKYVHNVKSEFRLEASAKVKGNAISPFISKEILVKI